MKRKAVVALILALTVSTMVPSTMVFADQDVKAQSAADGDVVGAPKEVSGDIANVANQKGEYVLSGDAMLQWSDCGAWYASVTIDLNGHTLDLNGHNLVAHDNATYTIKDSKGTGKVVGAKGIGTEGSGKIVLLGGTYDADITKYASNATKSGNSWVVGGSVTNPTEAPQPTDGPVSDAVAKIGSKQYDSLQDAVDSASNKATITLLKQADVTDGLEIPAGKTVTIDLADVDYYEDDEESAAIVAGDSKIDVYGNLTIKDSDGYVSLISGTGSEVISVHDNGKVTVESAFITAEDTNTTAVALEGKGALVVDAASTNDAVLQSVGASTVKAKGNSTVTLEEGAIWNAGNGAAIEASTKGAVTVNGGFVRSGGLDGAKGSNLVKLSGTTLTVTDGRFRTDSGKNFTKSNSASVEVSGGLFKQQLDEADVADGLQPVKVTSGEFAGYWTVEEGQAAPTPTKKPSNLQSKIMGLNLELKGQIGGSALVRVPADAADGYAILTMNGEETKVNFSDLDGEDYNGDLLFQINKYVKAKETTDTINIKIYTADGAEIPVYYGKTKYADGYDFTIKSIAETYQNTGDKTTKALAKAIQNYGAYAQKLMKYKTGNASVTDNLSDISASNLKAYAKNVSGKVTGVKYIGASLSLQADTVLNVYFNFSKDSSNYTVKLNGKKVDLVDDGVVISGIKASELDKVNTITVSDGSSTMTVKVSALTWAYDVVSNSASDANNLNMAKMAYRYNQAAKDYFDAH
uniref:hypothetical protein n=1 Tax=Eubacterium cellulosolvens TaxID=29322 RepID=UPI00047FE4C9|nr:hypothetical protein [[Eubacterium] cellulosolvens]